jgi:hypothetical protein
VFQIYERTYSNALIKLRNKCPYNELINLIPDSPDSWSACDLDLSSPPDSGSSIHYRSDAGTATTLSPWIPDHHHMATDKCHTHQGWRDACPSWLDAWWSCLVIYSYSLILLQPGDTQCKFMLTCSYLSYSHLPIYVLCISRVYWHCGSKCIQNNTAREKRLTPSAPPPQVLELSQTQVWPIRRQISSLTCT